jgi:hypothetical protein
MANMKPASPPSSRPKASDEQLRKIPKFYDGRDFYKSSSTAIIRLLLDSGMRQVTDQATLRVLRGEVTAVHLDGSAVQPALS